MQSSFGAVASANHPCVILLSLAVRSSWVTGMVSLCLFVCLSLSLFLSLLLTLSSLMFSLLKSSQPHSPSPLTGSDPLATPPPPLLWAALHRALVSLPVKAGMVAATSLRAVGGFSEMEQTNCLAQGLALGSAQSQGSTCALHLHLISFPSS